jgi:hypothetical protein
MEFFFEDIDPLWFGRHRQPTRPLRPLRIKSAPCGLTFNRGFEWTHKKERLILELNSAEKSGGFGEQGISVIAESKSECRVPIKSEPLLHSSTMRMDNPYKPTFVGVLFLHHCGVSCCLV